MYRGYFINLDRNSRRRAAIEDNLRAVGAMCRYQRMPAVDGRAPGGQYATKLRPGSLGLWLTHERILSDHNPSDGHLHILEDDAMLGSNAVASIEKVLRHLDTTQPDWDLLHTETFVGFDQFRIYRQLMQRFDTSRAHACLDLSSLYLACSSSIVINAGSIAKYAEIITGNWSLGIPFDMYLRKFIRDGRLKSYVTVPFISTISRESDQSDIRGDLDISRRVYDTYRRSFFQDADLEALQEEMRALTRGTAVSPLTALHLDGLAFYHSDKWVGF